MEKHTNSDPKVGSESSAEMVNPELTAYYGNRPLMWRNLMLILLLNLGWAISFTVISPLVQLRLNKMGISESSWGVMSGINFWVYSYAVMYFAWKSDHTVSRFGRRIPYLFLSSSVIILTIFFFPFTEFKWILVGLVLLQMFFTDIKYATIPLLNIDCMPRQMIARSYAPATITIGLLSFFSLRYGFKLADWSEHAPYLVGGGILICTTLLAGFFIKEPPIKNPTKEKFMPWSAMKVAWRDKRAIVLMISVSLFQTFQVAYNTWIWLYAKNALHMSRGETGLAMSWSILVSMASAFPISWLIDRISPYRLLPVFCMLNGLSLVCLLHTKNSAGLAIAASIATVAMAFYGASDIMVYRKAHPAEIGSVTSTNSCLRGFYNGCMGFLTGCIIGRSGGHYDYAFILAFVLTALGLVPLFFYRRLMDDGQKCFKKESVSAKAGEVHSSVG